MQTDINVVRNDEDRMRYSHSSLHLPDVRVKKPLQGILRIL